MTEYQERLFERLVEALEKIACTVDQPDPYKPGTLQMRDVDRAKVYSEHLGEKMRKQ